MTTNQHVQIKETPLPLRERDGALKENWYIACLSSELTNEPLSLRIYQQRIVLFRDASGQPSALKDRCLHRAALLSKGQVHEGQLLCPYHSWTYDREGEVVEVPSEGPGKQKGRRCQKSYPAVEQDGVIWLWMGEGEPDLSNRNPSWRFPHYGEKGWSHYYMVTDFDNEVTNLVENFMDVPHTVSVHKGWFRNKSLQKVPIVTETKKGEVLVTYDQPEDSIGVLIKPLLNPTGAPMVHTDKFIYPNITRVDYSFGDRFQYVINSQCTPVDDYKTRVYTYIAYKLPVVGKVLKPFIHFYTRQVINQDVWIMDVQSQSLKDDDQTPFQSTPADEPHLQIERLRRLGQKGELEKLYKVEKRVEGYLYI